MVKTMEVTETRISCRRPPGLRIGLGVPGLLFGAACAGLLIYAWPSAASLAQRSPADVLCQIVPILLVPIVGLFFPTGLFLYIAGPADLILDTAQRRYRFRRGFPLLASWQEGPLDDIAGLRVHALSSRSGASYQLMLDWKNTQAAFWTLGDGAVAGRRPVQLEVSRDMTRLRQDAQKLAQRLGVPVEERMPAGEHSRRKAQRLLILGPVLLFFLLYGLPPLLVNQALQSQGQTTSGMVTALRHGKGYSVRYTYSVEGRSFDGHVSVPRVFYDTMDVGSPVTVSHLPTYPHTSTLTGAQNSRNGTLFLLYGGVFAVLILWTSRSRQAAS